MSQAKETVQSERRDGTVVGYLLMALINPIKF
jgi:hypothetical protein